MTKRVVVVCVGVPLAVLLVALSQTWATGTSQDAVLGRATITVTGSQMVPAAVGLALVIAAALIAMLTGGPSIRTAAGVLMALAALTTGVLVVTSLGSADLALGRRAAELAGRTGAAVPVTSALGPERNHRHTISQGVGCTPEPACGCGQEWGVRHALSGPDRINPAG